MDPILLRQVVLVPLNRVGVRMDKEYDRRESEEAQ